MRTIINLFLLTGSLLLASCSQGDDALASGDGGDVQVPITVEASIADAALTRTTSGYTAVPDGGVIGIFRTLPVTETNPAQYDVSYSYAGSTNTWSPVDLDKLISVGVENVTLCAYYPQGQAIFDSESTITELTVKSYTDENDLCYAAAPVQLAVNSTQRLVSFQMDHAYSRVQFSITHSSSKGSDTPCKITSIKMAPVTKDSEFYIARTIDISKLVTDESQLGGTIAANWVLDTSTQNIGTKGIIKGGTDTSIDMLFPPQKFSNDVDTKLTLKVNDKNMKVTIPYATLPELEPGVIYQIDLEIELGMGLVVNGVQIKEWEVEDLSDQDATLN